MFYKLLKELLFNNKTNFKADVVKYYLQKLVIYHLQINEKIKNFNSILKDMLTKYLTDKSTIL